jgi:4-amino-4-deoxy-L-arabinose transferase-like glycosyltransferase
MAPSADAPKIRPFGRRLFQLRPELPIILALAFAALLPGINGRPLTDWDEARYAQVAHEALANQQFLDFTWNGKPYVNKPPVLFWTLALSFKVLGESEWAARLPSVLMGVGTILIVYLTGSFAAGRLAGTFAALIPLGCYEFVARGARECATDSPLVFFSALALYAFVRARLNHRWLALSAGAAGLAILTKGIAGLIPLLTALVALVLIPAFRAIRARGLITLFMGAAAAATPWYLYQAIHNPLFWSEFVGRETLDRVMTHLEGELKPANFTLQVYARELTYLWPMLAAVLLLAVIDRRGLQSALRRAGGPSVAVWAIWLIAALGSACAVQTKLSWYVVPALIPTALLIATAAASLFTFEGESRRYAFAIGTLALAAILGGAPERWRLIELGFQQQRDFSLASYRMGLRARSAAEERGGGELFFAGAELPTLVYYSSLRCHFVATAIANDISQGPNMDSTPVSIGPGDLVLLDSGGEATTISNWALEWTQTMSRDSGEVAEMADGAAPSETMDVSRSPASGDLAGDARAF